MSQVLLVSTALFLATLGTMVPGAVAAHQNDCGLGGDAANSWDAASAVSSSASCMGQMLATEGDMADFYRFPVNDGATIRVTMTPTSAACPDSGMDMDLLLYDSRGSDLTQNVRVTSRNPGCQMEVAEFTADVGGDWRVRVDYFVSPPTGSYRLTISVTATNQPPTACFSATTTDHVVSVDARCSGDPEGAALGYFWQWGDGTAESSTNAFATHSYPCPGGTFQVRLTVTDPAGATDAAASDVTAVDQRDNDLPSADGLVRCREDLQATSDVDWDSDDDGINDLVESEWWDASRRKLAFCPALGSDDAFCDYPHPTERDLYVEVDWYQGHPFLDQARQQALNAYGLSPLTIDLWVTIDRGPLGGGGSVFSGDGVATLDDVASRRLTDMRPERQGIYHYLVIACRSPGDTYDPVTGTGRIVWGQGEAPGENAIIYDCRLDSGAQTNPYDRPTGQAMEFMHEVGHNYLGQHIDLTACTNPDFARLHNARLSHFNQPENLARTDCNRDARQDIWVHMNDRNDAMISGGPPAKESADYLPATWNAIRLDWSIDGSAPDCRELFGIPALLGAIIPQCYADQHVDEQMVAPSQGGPGASGFFLLGLGLLQGLVVGRGRRVATRPT